MEYRLAHDWGFIRSKVFRRDRGVCALCGSDTLFYRDMVVKCGRAVSPAYGERDAFYRAMLGYANPIRDPWDADHIVGRVEGGAHDLENLRTLCGRCHRGITATQARRRAERRRRDDFDENGLFG
jgi:5-methylcytosine-specific restriction protein A